MEEVHKCRFFKVKCILEGAVGGGFHCIQKLEAVYVQELKGKGGLRSVLDNAGELGVLATGNQRQGSQKQDSKAFHTLRI